MNGSVLYDGNTLLSGAINVNTGGNIEPLEVEVAENGTQTINAPVGVDGYNPITISTNVPSVEPVLDDITITENGSYTPPSGVDGYDEVNVNVPQPTPVLDDITITENGTYTPPSGTDGYNDITVNVPLPENSYLLKEYEDVPTNIASFTASDAPLKSLTASIVPVQAGSGDPSPTNIRPISGWTEEVITVADDTTSPTVEQTYTIPFTDGQGQSVEVFGGSVDVVNGGEQQRTLASVDLATVSREYNSGWNCWVIQATSVPNAKIVDSNTTPTNAMSDRFKTVKASGYTSSHESNTIAQNTSGIWFIDNGSTTELSGQLVYELATPTTFYTQPTSIKSLDGENNVFASTGQIETLEFFTKEE